MSAVSIWHQLCCHNVPYTRGFPGCGVGNLSDFIPRLTESRLEDHGPWGLGLSWRCSGFSHACLPSLFNAEAALGVISV